VLIAVDSSGSLTQSGFEAVKVFAENVVVKYRSKYYGSAAAKIGIVLFGNGNILSDGITVAPALAAQQLTADTTAVLDTIRTLPFKRGFTNLAQALSLADTMFSLHGRQSAQSALLVITDGKPALVHQTDDAMQKLADRNVKRFFVVVSADAGNEQNKEVQLLRRWVSEPWHAHMLRIPGIDALRADDTLWVRKVISGFCPDSFSPTWHLNEEHSQGFMKVLKGAYCGSLGDLLSTAVPNAQACYDASKRRGFTAFVLGKQAKAGQCYGSTVQVNADMIATWESHRESPACPAGHETTPQMMFDFFSISAGHNRHGFR
jgi:uncharacterized protein YegL